MKTIPTKLGKKTEVTTGQIKYINNSNGIYPRPTSVYNYCFPVSACHLLHHPCLHLKQINEQTLAYHYFQRSKKKKDVGMRKPKYIDNRHGTYLGGHTGRGHCLFDLKSVDPMLLLIPKIK